MGECEREKRKPERKRGREREREREREKEKERERKRERGTPQAVKWKFRTRCTEGEKIGICLKHMYVTTDPNLLVIETKPFPLH